ncbi:hypothetical protein CTI14_41635, partial [Methylobacterium radiotolerans]
AWYRFNSLDGLNPGNLTRDAAQVARTQGEGGLATRTSAACARSCAWINTPTCCPSGMLRGLGYVLAGAAR